MSVALVTGSCGLIGSEAVGFLSNLGFDVVGIDNNMRMYFFGKDGNVLWNQKRLQKEYKNYTHFSADIRDKAKIEKIFKKYSSNITLIIHAAAQPSHDWAVQEPITDFTINANGTLLLLENFRKSCPKAVFIFCSTNKVYGDRPNSLPLIEHEKRWELPKEHQYYNGIDEGMSIDNCKHSLFGVSKVAADVLVQEYGKYFDLKTVAFRGGCLTGPFHSGAMLHGFLSYLIKCVLEGIPYTIFGYKGKQVRDNIHSFDLVNAFYHFYRKPRSGEVYNIGGSRFSNISILEAIEKIEELSGKKAVYEYSDENRIGDHIWYISDVSKFKKHYPEWDFKYNMDTILEEIYQQSHFSKKL